MTLITREMPISQIVRDYPETRTVLMDYGMPCPDCMGALVGSLQDGARMHGVSLEKLMADLNEAVTKARES